MTRLHAVLNLFRYDQRRLLGLLAALRPDPMAAVAGAGLLFGGAVGLGWALAARWSEMPPAVAPGLGLALGAGLVLPLRPLSGLRAGPLRELADDRAAVWIWLCLRSLALFATAVLVVAGAAGPMGWRPDSVFVTVLAVAFAGVVVAAAITLFLARPSFRLPAFRAGSSSSSPRFSTRAARLAWIDLTRRQSGLPVGAWSALCWIAALLIAPAFPEPRLAPVVSGAVMGLAFLATAAALRFDAATVRLLTFEPTSFFGLTRDVLGLRLLAMAAIAALLALVATPAALAGAALGAALRSLEFLHAVRRSANAARLFAQVETGLVVALAFVAGPLAGLWLILRAGWLYRRASRTMGLT